MMSPQEVLASARNAFERDVAKYTEVILSKVEEALKADPTIKALRVFTGHTNDRLGEAVTERLARAGFQAKLVVPFLTTNYFLVSGWAEKKPATPDAGPYRA